MENYISINNAKIPLTDEQVAKIIEARSQSNIMLSDIAVGETVKIGEHEMIVLEQSGDTTALICRGMYRENTAFGKNNNYNGSNADGICNGFADEIAAIIGEKNIVMYTVDLTSDDGLKDYGKVRRLASLLTADLYRRYVEILDKHKLKEWWWLATPYSTGKHENTSWVKCVSPSGSFNYFSYNGVVIGVRPFCILKSNIFVSK